MEIVKDEPKQRQKCYGCDKRRVCQQVRFQATHRPPLTWLCQQCIRSGLWDAAGKCPET